MVDKEIDSKKSSKRPLSEIKRDQYKKENYTQLIIRSRNKGIRDTLDKAAAIHGISRTEYIRMAINRQLESDGYIKDSDKV